eukprot:gene13081-biopygen470
MGTRCRIIWCSGWVPGAASGVQDGYLVPHLVFRMGTWCRIWCSVFAHTFRVPSVRVCSCSLFLDLFFWDFVVFEYIALLCTGACVCGPRSRVCCGASGSRVRAAASFNEPRVRSAGAV